MKKQFFEKELIRQIVIPDLNKLREESFFNNNFFKEPENSIFNFYLNFETNKNTVTKNAEPLFLTEMANDNFIFDVIYSFLERKKDTFTENERTLISPLLKKQLK